MLTWLPRPLVGIIMSLLLMINTLLWASALYVLILIKLMLPRGALFDAVSHRMSQLAQRWAACNSFMANHLLDIDWQIELPETLNPSGQYIACANHQSWNDIFVLMRAFDSRTPFFKFFLKQELIWVPVLGLAWWGLDYPFMKRYTRAQVTKNPHLKGKDMETTRKSCERFKRLPVLVLNFLEGTRFTEVKHARQNSPYRHLLKPKSGGLAFAIAAFDNNITQLLDITIAYPQGSVGFWQFLCGDVKQVVVKARELEIPAEVMNGNYEDDPAFRATVHQWVASIWQQKDDQLAEILQAKKSSA